MYEQSLPPDMITSFAELLSNWTHITDASWDLNGGRVKRCVSMFQMWTVLFLTQIPSKSLAGGLNTRRPYGIPLGIWKRLHMPLLRFCCTLGDILAVSYSPGTVVDVLIGMYLASYDPVQEGDKIIETAIKNFGRIDILLGEWVISVGVLY